MLARPTPTTRRARAAFRGCILGGAVGDALGAPIEFLKLGEIRGRYGPGGVMDLVPGAWPAGSITDDTQLTLFTAEALLRERHAPARNGDGAPLSAAARAAYQRWLHTQGERAPADVLDGWLVRVTGLHERRAPGTTCLGPLRDGPGEAEAAGAVNGSKGCGGVMRVAPVGLALSEGAFGAGCEAAAVTHGHPTGQLAAGAFAHIVAEVSLGETLHDAAEDAVALLGLHRGHEETTNALEAALDLAADGGPSALKVEALGGGWVAEEALAIGVYCALVARDFAHGVLLAVNHGGDSDSTGSIAGNLLGLLHGETGIPRRWLERLELRDVVTQVADDLWAHFGEGGAGCEPEDVGRYPGA